MSLTATRAQAVVLLVAALMGIAVTTRLGVWQLSRASQKEAMQSAFEVRGNLPPLDGAALARTAEASADQLYRPVRLRGTWLPERTIYLDNRQMNDRVGFYVVTPLLLAHETDAVLVQRGWVQRSLLDRTALPLLQTPEGVVEIEGIIAPPPGRLFEFTSAAGGTIRQNVHIDEFSRETGLALRPLSVQQVDSQSTVGDGLMRQWPRPALNIQTNYGYAFQWFAMAALMAGLYVWYQLVRPRLRRRV